MKAVRIKAWGQPVQLEDIPAPKPANDEVLVRVHAASINPFDVFVHSGYMQGMMNVPLTMGTDFAGDVVEVGSAITHVKPGDAVYGLVPFGASGAFAEYLVAKENQVTQKPGSLSYIEAAGVPLASLAGCQSLLTLGEAKAGESVLIIGAAGAVGGCSLQIAKELGMKVYAVDVPDKAGFVKELGPDRFIDAKAERFEDVVGKVDLVLDFVGGDNTLRSYNVLPSGGRYVTSLFLPDPNPEAEKRGIKASALATQPRVDNLNELADRIDRGVLKIFINRTFALTDVQAALDYRATTTEPGKVVLTII